MGKPGNWFASRICQWVSSFGKESEGQPTFFRRLKASIPFQHVKRIEVFNLKEPQ
jgi:hypothetical protein